MAKTEKPEKKKKKRAELDTETTFANMNVEGFKWYDPTLEKRLQDKKNGIIPPKVSRREYWRMVRGAFAAFLPYLLIIIAIFGIMIAIAYLWLKP